MKLKTGLLAAITIFLGGCSFLAKSPPTPAPTASPQAETQELRFDPSLPYVSIWPRSDGKALTIKISGAARFQRIEAKVQYQTSDGRSQGFFKTLKPEGKDLVEGEGIFGSCSRGVCKYDQGVSGGSIELAFQEPEGAESFWKAKFKIIKAKAGETVKSPDGKLAFTPPKDTVLVIHQLLGLPKAGVEIFQDEAYGIYDPKGSAEGKVGIVFFETPSEFDRLEVVYWNGRAWQAAPTTRQKDQNQLVAAISGSPLVVRQAPNP